MRLGATMPKMPFLIMFSLILITAGCGDYETWPPPGPPTYCPETYGNYLELTGRNLDSVYNELLILPSGVIVKGIPKFYPDIQVCPTCSIYTFEWSLPYDMNHDTTKFILRGNGRNDTITVNYSRKLTQRTGCGIQLVAENLNVQSVLPFNFISHDSTVYNKADSFLGVWRIWLDL